MYARNYISWLFAVLMCCLAATAATAAEDSASSSSCNTGTIEDDCVSANDENEFFYCTDRYSWEWSQDVQQLPTQASDSLCLTIDSDVVPALSETELLVLGGCDAEYQEEAVGCQSLSNSTRVYNPFLDQFEFKASMPTSRFRAAAVNVSEHVYLFGGRDTNGTLTCNVDRYNVVTGEWTTLDVVQDTNCYSDHSGVASDDGTIYLFGGYSESYEAQDTVVKVDVSGDDMTFSTAAPMGLKRGDHSCIKLPGSSDVLCMGGFTEDDGEFEILQSVEHFDMQTETWGFKADMVKPRADFGVGLLNNRITVVGGEDSGGPMDDVEWYDPSSDCWTDSGKLFDLPYERLRYCAATVESNNRIYIFGGQSLSASSGGQENLAESSEAVYSIEETVNWYQEVLVDQLSPSNAAARSAHNSAILAVTAVVGVTSALLMTLRLP